MAVHLEVLLRPNTEVRHRNEEVTAADGWTGTIQEGMGGTTADHHLHHDAGSAHTRIHGHLRVLHHDADQHRLAVHLAGAEGVPATAHTAATVEAGAVHQAAHVIVAGDKYNINGKEQ